MGHLNGLGKTFYNGKQYNYNDITGKIAAPQDYYGGRVKHFGTVKEKGILLVLDGEEVIDIYIEDDQPEYIPFTPDPYEEDSAPLIDNMSRVELIKYAKELEIEGNVATMGSIKLKKLIAEKLENS